MKAHVVRLLLVLAVSISPAVAEAGWVVQLRNTVVKSNGERQEPETATMYVSRGKVRTVQPSSITIIDYNKGRFTLLNPERDFFWSGTVDEYVQEVQRNRKNTAAQRFGGGPAAQLDATQVDDSKLPAITVRKLGPGGKIAGHETVKYQVESDGELFQELWVADDVNFSADLDQKKFFDYQQKTSGFRLGKAAASMRASYRSKELREIYEKGLVLQTITHHVAGKFERVTTEVQRSEIPEKDFEVPDHYRRVRLADVFPVEEGS
jgi:hypothetical protein